MNPSQSSSRRRCAVRLAPEVLEGRELLTGSGGSTFAILPGTISTAGGTAEVKFTIDPSHFTIPKKGLLLGIDVAPDPSGTLQPQITGVTGPNGAHVPGVTHSRYAAHLPSGSASAGQMTSAVLTTVHLNAASPTAPVTYEVDVKAKAGTSGAFLLGFYLPGDANGDGVVNETDVSAVAAALGSIGGQTKYNFNADVNRDGKIGPVDVKDTLRNLGAATTVMPTASANLDQSGMVDSTQRVTRNPTATFTGSLTPGGTITFQQASGTGTPVTATADASGNYTATVPLVSGSNTFNVGTSDAFGQAITGTLNPVTYLTSPAVNPSDLPTAIPAGTTTTTAAPMIPATTTTPAATATATATSTPTPAATTTTATTTAADTTATMAATVIPTTTAATSTTATTPTTTPTATSTTATTSTTTTPATTTATTPTTTSTTSTPATNGMTTWTATTG